VSADVSTFKVNAVTNDPDVAVDVLGCSAYVNDILFILSHNINNNFLFFVII
jgi:hypothetical protein